MKTVTLGKNIKKVVKSLSTQALRMTLALAMMMMNLGYDSNTHAISKPEEYVDKDWQTVRKTLSSDNEKKKNGV